MNTKFIFFSLLLAGGLVLQSSAMAQNQPDPPIAAPAPAVAADLPAVLLKPQFVPGKTYRFTSSTAIRMKLLDQPGKTSNIVVEQRAKLIVNRRPSGEPGVFITASTEGVKFNLSAGKNKIAFDSSQQHAMETPVGKHFQSSMTRWTQMDVSLDGKLLTRRDGGGGGAATPLPHLPEIGPDQLQQLVASLLSNSPPEPVAPGKEWIHKGSTKLGPFGVMKFEISNRYTEDLLLDGATCAVVEFTGTIKGDVQIQGGGKANTLGFRGNKMSGRFLFDKKANITRASEQVVLMKVENEKLPKTTVEQQIRLRLDSIVESE